MYSYGEKVKYLYFIKNGVFEVTIYFLFLLIFENHYIYLIDLKEGRKIIKYWGFIKKRQYIDHSKRINECRHGTFESKMEI